MSPVTAVVARPEPIAPAAKELRPPAPTNPAAVPVRAALPAKLPSNGAKKGRNASGWPVMGFLVRDPVGDRDANP